MKKGILFIVSLLVSATIYAQNGFVRGTVIDTETGEGLLGATISQQGTTNGTTADFDGNYSLSLAPGSYNIEFRFFSYQSKVVSDVQVVAGEVTTLDVELGESTTELAEVVVTAEQIRDNEVALLTVQKKSANTIDGISSAAFKKVGDSDLGAAMKRVTGVSVQSGKHVYVRGLGDRYTKTTMNGMTIPGLDPDKNSVQIDMFPTNTIENVVVYKTFSPDLQGDFTGGAVNIETKSFPQEEYTSLSVGLGFNPEMHLRKSVSYEGGNTDFLGFDDGTRALPIARDLKIPNQVSNDPLTEEVARSFTPTLSADATSNFMNSSFSVAHGNQLDRGDMKIGYNAILNFRNTQEYYDNVEIGRYRKENDLDITDLAPESSTSGRQGVQDFFRNGMLAGALKFNNHSLSLSLMHTQNGISSAMDRNSANLDDNPAVLVEDVLTYTQRSVSNAILSGKHHVGRFDIEWRGALNKSRIYDPDMRETKIEIKDDNEYGLNTGVGAGIDRFYRDLNETNQSFKTDLSMPYGDKNKLKFGAIGTFKKREFETLNYYYRNQGSRVTLTGDAADLLADENIWNTESGEGLWVQGNFIPSDQFESNMQVYGAYAMTEMSLLSNLKAIYGLRTEVAQMRYTGSNTRREEFNNDLVLNELNVLPSVNLVYSLSENMNIRTAFNRTLARPTFSEKSNAQIYDPIRKITVLGNIDLEQTQIDNVDLRWEYFYSADEMVSISGFYKRFDGHIELTAFEVASDQFKPRNTDISTAYGLEFEFRKNVNELISVGTNASFIKSAVDIKSLNVGENDGAATEYEVRSEYARSGESVANTRPMAGQSPYLINAYANYKSFDNKLNANLSYNVQGRTLAYVGLGLYNDVYIVPFHSLNLNVSRPFGPQENMKLTAGIQNILGAERKYVTQSHGTPDRIFQVYRPGRTFTVKYAINF